MRRWLLMAGVFLAAGVPAARAQNSRDINVPGYILIRVILDGVGAGVDNPGGIGPGGVGPGGESTGPGGGPPGTSGGPPPGFGGPGGGAPPGAGGGKPADDARSIYVVAPYRSVTYKPFYPDKAVNQLRNPMWMVAKTKFGSTYLYNDDTSIQIIPLKEPRGQFLSSLETPIHERYRKWALDRKFDPIYELTIDALALGMVDDAFKYANEVMTLIDVMKDKAPPQKVQDFAKAWKAVAGKIDQAATQPNDAEEWRARLSAASVKQGKHYSIVYWGERQINPAELDRRLAALDRNFKAFYLWHALQGITLSVPNKPLVVLLADRSTDVYPLRDKLDGLAIQSDSFYSPSHDLLVLSPERMDNYGAAFTDLARASYKNGWSREELLKGVPKIGGQKQEPQEIARMMTLALVDRLLEEEMDNSAMSREATRQLYMASGLLPRNVQLPKWLESGLGSFMQHPKGPLFEKDDKGHTAMVAGLAYGFGSPNYILHRQYRELDGKRELNPRPEVLLRNVLTDRYFDAVRAGHDIDPPPERPAANSVPVGGSPSGPMGPMGPMRGGIGPMGSQGGPVGPMGSSGGPMGPMGGQPGDPNSVVMENEAMIKRNTRTKLQTKADATAWALVHYLSRDRMLGVQKFYAEIRRMPRDMRLDENYILITFCKCFNLMDKQKPNEIDQAAFKSFAESWVRSMKIVPPYGLDVPIESNQQGGNNPNGQGPMGPMGPGGVGGVPGRAPGRGP